MLYQGSRLAPPTAPASAERRASELQQLYDTLETLGVQVQEARAAVETSLTAVSTAQSGYKASCVDYDRAVAAVAAAAKARAETESAAAAAARRQKRERPSPLAEALDQHLAVLASPKPWVGPVKPRSSRMSVGAVTRLFSKPRTAALGASLVAQDGAERRAQVAIDAELLQKVHALRDIEFDARVTVVQLRLKMVEAKAAVTHAEGKRAHAVAHLNAIQRALTAAQGRQARLLAPKSPVSEDELTRRSSGGVRPSTAVATPRRASRDDEGGAKPTTSSVPRAWMRSKMAAAQAWAAKAAASTAKAAAGDARVAAVRYARAAKLQEQKEEEARRLAAAAAKRATTLQAAEEALARDAIRRGALDPPPAATLPSYTPMESPLTRLAPEYSQRRMSTDGPRGSFVVSSTPRSFLRSPRPAMADMLESEAMGGEQKVFVGMMPRASPPVVVSPRQNTTLAVKGMSLY